MRQPPAVERPTVGWRWSARLARDFRHPVGKSRGRRSGSRLRTANMLVISELSAAFRLASFLPLFRSEHLVVRASVFSIVLTLAVGPSAGLACSTWCEQKPAAARGHHHEAPAPSPSVPGDGACDDMALGSSQFLLEDVRRSVSALDTDDAILVPGYLRARSASAADPGQEPARAWWLENRPLSTALRI